MNRLRSHFSMEQYKHRAVLLCAIIVLSCAPSSLRAQGGSNYSIFGFGDIRESIGALYEGMGNTAIAMQSNYGINTVNPALWSSVRTTRLQTGFMFRQHRSTTADNSQLLQNNSMYTGINALFAMDSASGAALSIGYNPVTTVNVFTQARDSITYAGGVQYRTTDYRANGGISTLYVGGSFRPIEHLAVGVAVHHYFGNISSRLTTLFDDLGTFAQSFDETQDVFNGVLWQMGLSYTGIENLTLGATFSTPQTLRMTRSRRFYAAIVSTNDIFDTILVQDPVNPNYATTIGFGASYLMGRTMLGVDYLTRDFSATTYRNSGIAQFQRSTRMSVGAHYQGETNFSSSWFERLSYTAGAGINRQYVSVRNAPLSEIYGSIGAQIPLTPRARIDLSLTVGTRETTDSRILRETFGRFMVTLSAGDVWFINPYSRE